MNRIAKLLSQAGEYAATLSNKTRLRIVLSGLVLLLGGGVYKLVRSIDKLNEPTPAATPEQLLKPMEKLYSQTRAEIDNYVYKRRLTTAQLDSVSRLMHKSKKP